MWSRRRIRWFEELGNVVGRRALGAFDEGRYPLFHAGVYGFTLASVLD